MNRRGVVLLVIGVVLAGLFVAVVSIGIYFYEYHSFKTIRLCFGEGQETMFNCSDNQVCLDKIEEMQKEINLEGIPDFAREKLELIKEKSIYCEGMCKIREMRGFNLETQEIEEIESCSVGEEELVIEVRGKDALEMLDYLKS